MPVRMRSAPALGASGSFRVYDGSATRSVSSGSITIARSGLYHQFIQFAGSSFTTNRMSEMGANNDGDAFIDFNAEL